jgi:hypothetical protein
MDKLLEKPAKRPVFLLNLRKLFSKLKFWNSLMFFPGPDNRRRGMNDSRP